MTSSGERWILSGISGPVAGREFILVGQEIRLGRTTGNDIVIPEKNVSRHHASIILNGDDYWIKDANSRNGTFLNEQKISENPLNQNDTLRIGTCRFRITIELEGEEDEEEPRSADRKMQFAALADRLPQLGAKIQQIGRGRLLLYGGGLFFLLFLFIASQEQKPAPLPTTQNAQAYKLPSYVPQASHASDEEILAWKTRADRAMQVDDFQAAIPLLRKLVSARPYHEHTRAQLARAEALLGRQIAQFYENGAREYEKLYYDRAIREWQKVLALSAKFDPEMHKQTEEKIREATEQLRKRR